jgi:hypothetical protein
VENPNANIMQARSAAIAAMATPTAIPAIAPAERPPDECAGENSEVVEGVDGVVESSVLLLTPKLALKLLAAFEILVGPLILAPMVVMECFVALALMLCLEGDNNVAIA